jgi:hypothetical protein
MKTAPFKICVLSGLVLISLACTHRVKIEPSEKPFVVNLNVNIDHRIRMDIEEKNEDLLNLEEEVLSEG